MVRADAEDLLKLCSKLAEEYERLQGLSAQIETAVTPNPTPGPLPEGMTERGESDADLSTQWEVEIEEDSQDYSMSDQGDFTELQDNPAMSRTSAQVSMLLGSADRDQGELEKKVAVLESKLREFDVLKYDLDESDKQVKELVAILNAKDEVLSQLEKHGDSPQLLLECQTKLSLAEEKISSLEGDLDAKEKQNSELSEKLDAQLRLYTELEDICKSQESNLAEERKKVDNLVCDIKERDVRIDSLEQRFGLANCDRTESEPQSVNTSLDESHDEVSRALKEAELRHTEEMEEVTQMYNEEQQKLRENLKAVRAKEIELTEQIEELTHQHEQSLAGLKEDLQHERRQEVETLQSEFKVQMDIEVKKVTAELTSKHEEEVEKVRNEYKAKLEMLENPSREKLLTNGDSDHDASPDKAHSLEKVRESVKQELSQLHDKAIRQLTLEWEERVEKTQLELEEQWEDEKAELERKHKQEVANLQTQLKDAQEKLNKIIEGEKII